MSEQFHQIMRVGEYRVDESGSTSWKIFPNGRYYDALGEYGSFGLTFSIETLEVLDVTLNSELAYSHAPCSYRWINPAYKEAYLAELADDGEDPKDSGFDRDYVDIDVLEDILEKATAVLANEDFDRRVVMQLDLPKDVLDYIFRAAHEADITVNQFIEQLLLKEIERVTLGGMA